MKKSASLDHLDFELRRASEILDSCATMIRDIPLDPTHHHIKKIGDALTIVFEIQLRIYALRPELMPAVLKLHKEDAGSPVYEFIRPVRTDESVDQLDTAIATIQEVLTENKDLSNHHREIAEAEIHRLRRLKDI